MGGVIIIKIIKIIRFILRSRKEGPPRGNREEQNASTLRFLHASITPRLYYISTSIPAERRDKLTRKI